MTEEERKLARALILNDIVSKDIINALLNLKEELEVEGKNVSLPRLLLKNDLLTPQKLKKIRTALRKQNNSAENKDETSNHPEKSETQNTQVKQEKRDAADRSSESPGPEPQSPEGPDPGTSKKSPGRKRKTSNRSSRRRGRFFRNRSGATREMTRKKAREKVSEESDGPDEPVPGYLVKGVLGKGGMGAVFHTEKKESGEEYALKVLFPHHASDELAVERFIREGKLLTEFEHENIVKAFDYGEHNQFHYQVLELIEGDPVLDIINEEGAIDEETALDIIIQIAEALQYIQNQGVIHRDVKPDNVMIREDGTAILCDLGFAQWIGETDSTAPETTQGTVQYMSPEQAKGNEELDSRADIYSLGATLYHMVVGSVPFKGDEPQEVMAKQVMENLQGKEIKSSISNHMHYFIEKMMSKEKDFRFQEPAEVIDEISGHLDALESLEFDPDEEDLNPFSL